jgi:large subunit ribosomal protein L10
MILSSFRKESKGEKPELKAAFINGDVFVGDNQLIALTKIKTKNELIGEVIGLLQAPIQRVLGALQNKDEAAQPVAEVAVEQAAPVASVAEVAPEALAPVAEAPAVEAAPAAPEAEAPAAAPEAEAPAAE